MPPRVSFDVANTSTLVIMNLIVFHVQLSAPE